MGRESLHEAIVKPHEVRVSSSHLPLEGEGPDGVDSEAGFQESSFYYLGSGYVEGDLASIYEHSFLHGRASLLDLVRFLFALLIA